MGIIPNKCGFGSLLVEKRPYFIVPLNFSISRFVGGMFLFYCCFGIVVCFGNGLCFFVSRFCFLFLLFCLLFF
ncbi:hypothetical protein AKJ52_02755 [candidate division MSBL1 archaeon SCGC-AAA382C18]|uniref:Uncharacterized protein n=1 Tax=candidate division MSBL1 archaeon SCGC-AAA382C18 TaxID=1698281 RepID=A0A133VHP7_9EURY|nr:hypothetical protein AKJ52_02755 [candidate division MSBL1 archaeon SCGC-AAA382C18]